MFQNGDDRRSFHTDNPGFGSSTCRVWRVARNILQWGVPPLGQQSRVHERELATAGTNRTRHNSGAVWIRKVIRVTWEHVHKMWLERDKDRHGHEEAGRAEQLRQLSCLRGIAMWHDLRHAGELEMFDAEAQKCFIPPLMITVIERALLGCQKCGCVQTDLCHRCVSGKLRQQGRQLVECPKDTLG